LNSADETAQVKVPEVTLGFWIIKVAATTLGETAGDAVSMSMGLGYLVSTGIFAVFLTAAVVAQIRAERFNPWIYWTAIIATTTVGTTLADFADRSLGIGYPGGSLILLTLLLGTLFAWHRALGTISISSISSAQSEFFYWTTITFSQTLGTALGDWTADTAGLGYSGGIAIFVALLAIVALAYRFSRISHTTLFWIAFVLTRPLGAVLGDFLDKPMGDGGLELSRVGASAVLALFIFGCVAIFPQRTAGNPH
jgi:uncharacterized membrane-anchored protein